MSTFKIIAGINWVLVSLYGAFVLYHLFRANGSTDAAGAGLESVVKGFFLFLLIVLIGLNLLPYQWTRIAALLLGFLLIWMVYYIRTH